MRERSRAWIYAAATAAFGCSTPDTTPPSASDAGVAVQHVRDGGAVDVTALQDATQSVDAALIDATHDSGKGGGRDAAADGFADAAVSKEAATKKDAPSERDASPEAARDASSEKDAPAERDGASAKDAPTDAKHDAGAAPTEVILAAIRQGNAPIGASYNPTNGWSAVSTLGTDVYAPVGGGVAFMPGGRGVAVFRGNAGAMFESAIWSGTWSSLVAQGMTSTNFVSLPVGTSSGAIAAQESSEATLFDQLTTGSSTWLLGEATGTANNNASPPTLAITGTGAPMLLNVAQSTYTWSISSGAAWTAPAAVPGVAPPSMGPGMGEGQITAVGAAGGEVVAIFVVSSAMGGASTLASTTFLAGSWSGVKTVATDTPANAETIGVSLAALPDGRVAMAYVSGAGAVKVGFWTEAGGWGSFTAVPGITGATNLQAASVSLAAGVPGAELELGYVNATDHLEHIRLVTESSWSWSTPVVIDPTNAYLSISIASGT